MRKWDIYILRGSFRILRKNYELLYCALFKFYVGDFGNQILRKVLICNELTAEREINVCKQTFSSHKTESLGLVWNA